MKIEDSFLEPEVRDGFYIPSQVKQAWAAQLEILQEIDRICKKYAIPYFADWGTLLGVVRHGGFIPWDDDLDITMKRADFERFRDAAKKEMPDGFQIFSFDNHPDFWVFLKRVVSKNRICFEEDYLKKFYGFPYMVGIDIFILDFASLDAEENSERNRLARTVIEAADMIAEGKVSGREAANLLDTIEKILGVKLRNRKDLHALRVRMYQEAEKLFAKFSDEESAEFTRMMPNELYYENTFRLPKEYYKQQIWLPFENTLLPVPSGYDEMLRRRYGDYMKAVRTWGGHDYPFFETQKKQLQAVLDFDMPEYRYTGIAERDSRQGRASSLKGIVWEVCQVLEANVQVLREQGEPVFAILQESQQLAIDMGTLIEQCKGEDYPVIRTLECYCEALYQLSLSYTEETLYVLKEALLKVEESVRKEILERKEAVFIPYKAADWKYLQSVWQTALEDDSCDVYVIPIPYFYKEYDGAFRDMQYEAEKFPKNLNVVKYDEFNFELHYPELIFTQSPYDEFNPVMSVHTFFYSANLKNYTEKLVYIPPFVLEEFQKENYTEYHNMKYYCTMPGVINADQVIVQSENMKQLYVEKLTEFAGEDTRVIWEEKILGLGSPSEDVKTDSLEEKKNFPEEWYTYIEKPDDTYKKVVLYYIGVSSFIQHKEKMLAKMKDVFRIFEENQDDVVMLWRPQAIIKATLEQLEPQLYQGYCELEKEYQEKSSVIFDTFLDDKLAVEFCDAYYGDASPIAQMCHNAGKPVMLQDVTIC